MPMSVITSGLPCATRSRFVLLIGNREFPVASLQLADKEVYILLSRALQ